MLRELRIRNLAVVEAAVVPFGPGLNVLTGETGAGKSILLDALLLVSGARGTAELVRADAETATVEAVFAIAPRSPGLDVLDEAGLAPEEGEVVIRRELSRAGQLEYALMTPEEREKANPALATVTIIPRPNSDDSAPGES